MRFKIHDPAPLAECDCEACRPGPWVDEVDEDGLREYVERIWKPDHVDRVIAEVHALTSQRPPRGKIGGVTFEVLLSEADDARPDIRNARLWLQGISAGLGAIAQGNDAIVPVGYLCEGQSLLDMAATIDDIVERLPMPGDEVLMVPDSDGLAVHYELFIDAPCVGYKVTRADGAHGFIYFNPSDNDDGSDDPNVFVYTGLTGNPYTDSASTHFVQDFEDFENQAF